MFLGSKNPLLIFLQSYHVWVTSRHVTSCHVIHVSHVMLRHVTSCHVISPYVMSCHVMSRHVTSCHVMSRHATSRSVTSCHVMSCHVMSRHVTSKVAGRSLHCQLTFSTRNSFELSMTVFVGCLEGCQYHTASAVYDLVISIICIDILLKTHLFKLAFPLEFSPIHRTHYLDLILIFLLLLALWYDTYSIPGVRQRALAKNLFL